MEAPDIATARTIAALEGERVEVIGERTETSSTWVNVDGTLTTGQAGAPIWVRQGDGDGTAAADWAPVDLTLDVGADGGIAPRSHPADLRLAGGGVPKDGRLLSMSGPGGESVGVLWADALPKPRLEGPRAVFEDVGQGVDLVIEATRTGYEQFYIVKERPAQGQSPDLALTVTAQGLTAAEGEDGALQFADAQGNVIGVSRTPLAWDAGVDGERLHPITEPWTSGEDSPATTLAPVPDWGGESVPTAPPADEATGDAAARVAVADPAQVSSLPVGSDIETAESPGQVASPRATAAGASAPLVLTDAAVVISPDVVEMSLAPSEEFLADPKTRYPVVVDPDYAFAGSFDTFVQTGYNSDQSGVDELRVGTYNGGTTVARSFINWDLAGINRTSILEARLDLFEWHSWSCQARNWEVWDTGRAGPGTRINAQPYWSNRWALSSQTTGNSSACAPGWVSADVTSLVQAWANGAWGNVGMGLKAENEHDNFGWKRFNSSEAGWGVPTLYVRWNTPPGPATALTVTPSASNGGNWVGTTTPKLSATMHDADGIGHMLFLLCRANGDIIWQRNIENIADGQAGVVAVPPGVLTEGGQYTFWVRSHDGLQWNTADSTAYPAFTVDTTMPAAPLVSSTNYPNDGTWHGAAGQQGQFLLRMPASDSTLAGYEWGLDTTPSTSGVVATGDLLLPVTPPTQGIHVLQVRTVDKAGNRSGVVKYGFNVGRAGLTSPSDGAQVVRRVTLNVTGEPGFSHVRFNWRRGPDATVVQPVDLALLTRSDGSPLTSAWVPLSDREVEATWDAGTTLGHVPGPIQVQAVVANNSSGAGAYASAWVTVTVSPDAQNAASDSVGPGSVNLLTGDYSLSSTDVEEFGLSLGRATSSRDTRAGFEPQAERLSPTQRNMSATTGWAGWAADIASVTGRGHTGDNSLRVVANGTSSDSLAYLPALDLPSGATYRVTGWVFVPAATGLTPDSAAGLRLRAYWQDSAGSDTSALSAKATLTDSWQQLTLDVTIPASARTAAKIQLFNGFAGAGRAVFFDDLSVREIWAPLGPQWSLGTADEAADTAYTHISQNEPDVATLHLSGGGEVWFTSGGDGRWWPQPGAEGLTLSKTGLGQWRLAEIDGTVSTFATASTGVLEPGRSLRSNESLMSASGNFRLSMQGDGNLVIYGPQGALWWTGTAVPGSTLTMQTDGNLVVYGPNGVALWHTHSWGNPGSRVVMQNDGNLVVYRPDNYVPWHAGTYGPFPAEDNAKLVTTSPPAAAGQTRLLYDSVNGRLRLSRLIAPVEPGVDGWPTNTAACTSAVPAAGCEVVQLVYVTGGTPASTSGSSYGNYADRLVEVKLWSTAPDAAVTTAVSAVRYAYDDKGRLREVWDPRISPALKTRYDYDADGRVVQLGTPGELPWKFRYGTGGANSTVGNGDLVDRSSGRLLSVSRASLEPGTLDQAGPDTTSTLVYAVPTTRSAGGPYDLDAAALATWAQTRGPTDATAIFGPEDVPSVTTASATTPGKDGYRAATVHYLDASGRAVNTATPSGPNAPAAGFIDTAEYDQYGNVVRSLDATNRLLALDLLPSAATDLAALNLAQADTGTRAMALSSVSTYGLEGLDLLRSRGPLLRLAIGNDPNDVRLVHDLTTYVYDEGKPDGAAYHLPTTETEGVLIAGTDQVADVVVTKNRYDPIDGKPARESTSGWVHKQPTQVIVDAGPGGANVTAKVRYDAQGRAVESRKAGSTGTDAGTTLTVYYSATANTQVPDCGGKPGIAGLACRTYSAGPATGFDAGRMAAQLPVKTVSYNRYGSITAVTESATGPVNGAAVIQSRTTTTVYDDADRVVSVEIAGAGMTAPALGRTVSTYDPSSGDVVRMSTTKPDGSVTKVEKTFDQLGRMTRYADAAGGVTDSVFDRFGKPTRVSDSTGATTSFSYDRSIEPRGFVTSVQDSVAGTLSAVYGPDGQLTSQSLPGGVRLDVGHDANRSPVTRTYQRASDGVVIATSSVVQNGAGQWISSTTSASAKKYAYDRLGRLTDVQDTTLGAGVCTARQYGYNDRAERTSLRTKASSTSTCADPGSPDAAVVTYAYDTADRLVSESVNGGAWVYDPLGRITGAPVRGSPGARVANTFYANDLVASQTIEGVARQTWSLDPLQRFSSYTSESWAAGADGVPAWQQAVTKVNHYDSDSDSPAWIAEDASLPDEITRYVDGLDGNLAVQTGKSGARVLQLVDLHGDVMTTVPIRDARPPRTGPGSSTRRRTSSATPPT